MQYGQHKFSPSTDLLTPEEIAKVKESDLILTENLIVWGEQIMKPYMEKLVVCKFTEEDGKTPVRVFQIGPATPEQVEAVRKIKRAQSN